MHDREPRDDGLIRDQGSVNPKTRQDRLCVELGRLTDKTETETDVGIGKTEKYRKPKKNNRKKRKVGFNILTHFRLLISRPHIILAYKVTAFRRQPFIFI